MYCKGCGLGTIGGAQVGGAAFYIAPAALRWVPGYIGWAAVRLLDDR